MERRNWSLKILKELNYIDSLDSYNKADAIVEWYENNFENNLVTDIDLSNNDLKKFGELYYKNLNFLKKQKDEARLKLAQMRKMKKFLNI